MADKPQDETVTVFEGIILVATAGDPAGIRIQEREEGLELISPSLNKPVLSVAEARELARQLYRLAGRLEKRLAAATPTKDTPQ